MAKLLVQESAGVREFELVDAEVHIGRELDNALRLSDPSISRHHAMIRKTAEGYEVQDLQSSNGVLVNGNRVQTMLLQDGDRVTLGQIQITFVDPVPMAQATNPLGTVRMNPEEMAKFQARQSPAAGGPLQTDPVGFPAAPAPEPVAAPRPEPPKAAIPPTAPRPHPAVSGDNPAPAFLAFLLPPVPDPARPTGERGDFVTRLLAHLLDGVIFSVPFILLYILIAIVMVVLVRTAPGLAVALGCFFSLVYLAVAIGYLILIPWCWMKFGATPGKKIMKLRVVPEDNPDGRIDLPAAVLRIVGHIINGMLFSLPYLMILGSERKGLQDILSKSIVIKVDR